MTITRRHFLISGAALAAGRSLRISTAADRQPMILGRPRSQAEVDAAGRQLRRRTHTV